MFSVICPSRASSSCLPTPTTFAPPSLLLPWPPALQQQPPAAPVVDAECLAYVAPAHCSSCSLAGWLPKPSARACFCLPRGGTSWHPTPRALLRSTSGPPPPAARAPQIEREHHGIGVQHAVAPLHRDADSAAVLHHHVRCAELPRTPTDCPGREQRVRRHGVSGCCTR